jgi:autotransporter-associated beta strand protein
MQAGTVSLANALTSNPTPNAYRYSGGTSIMEGTIVSFEAGGTPVGTGAIQLVGSTLSLQPVATNLPVAGTLTLAGTNTYSGGTILNAGTLVVNNNQALGLGNVSVNAGILRTDPQPINVLGNYTQTGGTLQLQIDGAGSGQYDFLNVSGRASLGGTLQLVLLGYQPKVGDRLTLVSAKGSITGRFANWVNPFTTRTGLNTIDLVYGRNSVVLQFLNAVPPGPVITTIDFQSFAQTPNQTAAANLLDAVQLDPRAANLMAFFD